MYSLSIFISTHKIERLRSPYNYVSQIIPAENIVAAFQGSQKTVFAISNTPSEAQIFLEVSIESSIIEED